MFGLCHTCSIPLCSAFLWAGCVLSVEILHPLNLTEAFWGAWLIRG